jgi:hypothetical protein
MAAWMSVLETKAQKANGSQIGQMVTTNAVDLISIGKRINQVDIKWQWKKNCLFTGDILSSGLVLWACFDKTDREVGALG